jgi:hypothetical protein
MRWSTAARQALDVIYRRGNRTAKTGIASFKEWKLRLNKDMRWSDPGRDGQAARRFGIAQPRVSEITRGKVELLSLDYLVGLCAKAGIGVGLKLAA